MAILDGPNTLRKRRRLATHRSIEYPGLGFPQQWEQPPLLSRHTQQFQLLWQ